MNVKRASLNSNKNQKLFSQLKYSLNGKMIVIQIEASFGAPLMIRFVSYWSHRICYSNQFIDLHLTALQILRLLRWWYDHPWWDQCIDIGNWLDKWNHRVPTLLYALSVLSIHLSFCISIPKRIAVNGAFFLKHRLMASSSAFIQSKYRELKTEPRNWSSICSSILYCRPK